MLAQYKIKMTLTYILHSSPSPHRNICLPVRRTVCRIFKRAICRTALSSSFWLFLYTSARISWRRRPYFPQVLPLLRSGFDRTPQTFVEACFHQRLLLAQLPANLFDDHFLRCVTECVVHELPILFCQIHDKTCGFAHSIPNQLEEGSTCSDQSS